MKTREHSRSVLPRGASILILLLCAGPAVAEIDFSPLPVAFIENMSGESTSPSTPELDLLGTSGLDLVDATYTGTAAHLMVDEMVFSSLTRFDLIDVESMATHGSDYGFRAEFENLSLAGDGTADLVLGASFPAVGPGSLSQIRVGILLITDFTNGDFATLFIEEFNPDDPPNPFGTSSVALTTAEATAILAGAHVRLDLFINDSGGNAIAEVEINGVPASAGGFLSLVDYDQQTLGFAFFGLTNFLGFFSPVPTNVDLTLVEAYADVQPLSFEPVFNVDVGGTSGTPTSNFAAAGGSGAWNTFQSIGGIPLVDVDGIASGVSATLETESILNFGTGYVNDLRALLTDVGEDCSPPAQWNLTFSGLTNGVYKVFVYASVSPGYQTGDISFNGTMAIDSLPGIFPPELIKGTSWDSAFAVVSGGTLSLAGLGNGAVSCAAIAGVQLSVGTSIAVPPSVPSLGTPALFVLVSLLLVARQMRVARRQA